ncbi:hypothetical protein ABL840_32620 [Variovorax sp. NFACC27]|nr:hypothetical protein SAMN03159371_07524 [Variovorax sp. NFACC28]SEG99166.1 hypothetical protein SAMN03159365_07500 [Variovorax sp. NFACC29]SFE17782.1 hypothetical protein SAMN03159379_07466 [Variovorax sp. NFACC26]SFH23554.1 hypothetical protein SAMN03159447_07374 [Variovorax sp. NFACC27]
MGALPSGGMVQMPSGMYLPVVQPNAVPCYVEYLKMSFTSLQQAQDGPAR